MTTKADPRKGRYLKRVEVDLDQFDELVDLFVRAATMDIKYAEKMCRNAQSILHRREGQARRKQLQDERE